MLGLFALPTGTATVVATAVHAVTLVGAIAALLLGPMSSRELLSTRRLLAAALVASGGGLVVATLLAGENGVVPVPSIADPISLAWVPLAVLGFLRVPRKEQNKAANVRAFADAALCTSALLFASWMVVLEPVLTQQGRSALTVGVQSAYPLTDVFVAALLLALLPIVRSDVRGFFETVLAGLVLIAVGDSGVTLAVVRNGASSFGWQDVFLQLGMALLVIAPFRRTGHHSSRRRGAVLDVSVAQASALIGGGVALWTSVRGHALDVEDVLLGVLMLFAGICRQLLHSSELVRLVELHRVAAEQDALTEVASRHAFLAALSERLSSATMPDTAVVLLDLDGFQEVNDSFGQETGDAVLHAVAARARAVCAPHLVGRMGSDEFAVLVVSADADADADALAQRLAGSHPVQADDASFDIGGSVGWAVNAPGDTAAQLLARAKLALQAAKAAPASVAGYSEALGVTSQRRHLLIAGLAHAVDRGELSLMYQPVRCLLDDQLVAVEALLRWRHPQLGEVAPGEFVPLAEDSGHIQRIGSWVLEEAIAQVGRWDDLGRSLPQLFVNLSAKQLTPDLPGRVLELLSEHGVGRQRLVLEVTESQLPGVSADDALAQLRAAGVQVALDDFGSGYSSLAQLVRLPVDIVKLDRDLVANLGQPGGDAVLTAAVALARALGLRTVAEGIETEAELAAVVGAGADLGQGYLFARPMAAADVGGLLRHEVDLPRPRQGIRR
jgi:diguanylate cyclase (GGDEF)-like protein